MIILSDWPAVSAFLDNIDLDADLCALVARRYLEWLLSGHHPRRKLPRTVIVQGGDTPEVINRALGREITGDGADQPEGLDIRDHGRWFQIIFPPDHRGQLRALVENGPGTELGIHHLCLTGCDDTKVRW